MEEVYYKPKKVNQKVYCKKSTPKLHIKELKHTIKFSSASNKKY